MQISWAARTDPGLRRAQNEDSYRACPDVGLFVVADGMGGHAGGEVASELAVAEIQKVIESTTSLGPQDTWPVPFDRSCGRDGNRLRAGFDIANRRIAQHMAGAENLRGMATTAVAVLLNGGGQAALAHVGDSRAYLYRADRLTRLTSDHSWVEEQMRAGVLTEAAAREHPWRNIVTRALSGADDLRVDVAELDLQAGDRLLLCSDGLSSVLKDSAIGNIVAAARDLESGCEELVNQANAAGGPDNITTLLLDMAAEPGCRDPRPSVVNLFPPDCRRHVSGHEMLENLRHLIRYRGLIQTLVTRELKARYRGSVLGFFWSFINPLLLLLVLPRSSFPSFFLAFGMTPRSIPMPCSCSVGCCHGSGFRRLSWRRRTRCSWAAT